MSKSIEINYLGDSGYEALYPSTMLNSVLDWQENLYSKNEILDSATTALYGLGEDSVPDDVLKILSKAAIVGSDGNLNLPSGSLIKKFSFGHGSYTGTGGGVFYVSFPLLPELIIVISPTGERNSNLAIIQKTESGEYISAGFNYYQSGQKAMFSVVKCTVSENSVSMTGTNLGTGSLNQSGLLYNYFYLYYGEG